ncbi:MAG: DUF420 domain-containing protein [Myxococcales bacterium FL481]|nr:MAG: DUF420 domain-containing protein [Myxococcales bacterium FL481]
MAELVMTRTKWNGWIKAISIVVPVLVAALFAVRIEGYDLSFLPPIYASVNAATAVLLVAGLLAIQRGHHRLHQRLMQLCVGLSASFLVMYVAYHMTSDPTPFGGQGAARYAYYVLLVSHILLSIVVLPFVLTTYLRASLGDFPAHRKIAKRTFPIWLYVTVSGVIVYLMISPYYGS